MWGLLVLYYGFHCGSGAAEGGGLLCGICVVLDSVSGGDGERDVVHGSSGSSNEKRRASYRPTRTAPPRERTRWEGLLSAEKVACEDKECHRYEIHEMFQGNLGRISQQNRLVLILFRNCGKSSQLGKGAGHLFHPRFDQLENRILNTAFSSAS